MSNPTLVQQYDDLEMQFFEGSVHNDYLAMIGGDWGWENGDGDGDGGGVEKIYGVSHFSSRSEPYKFEVSLPTSFSIRLSYPRFRSNDETNPAMIGGDWGFNDMNNKCVINGVDNDECDGLSTPNPNSSTTTHLCNLNKSPQPYQHHIM